MSDSPRFSAHFDEEAFAEDLGHASNAGRRVAEAERTRIERDGIPIAELLGCDPEARDGTRLAGCVKTYLPQPDGDWGMVFTGDTDGRGNPVLVYLAFGMRHPRQPWQPSLYQVAHRRLHSPASD
jgi:hypothetical protein